MVFGLMHSELQILQLLTNLSQKVRLQITRKFLVIAIAKMKRLAGPGWSSFLTGVWADKHGVNDNTFRGQNYDEYPHFFVHLKRAFPKQLPDHLLIGSRLTRLFFVMQMYEKSVRHQAKIACHRRMKN
jgi:hypothetical protein